MTLNSILWHLHKRECETPYEIKDRDKDQYNNNRQLLSIKADWLEGGQYLALKVMVTC